MRAARAACPGRGRACLFPPLAHRAGSALPPLPPAVVPAALPPPAQVPVNTKTTAQQPGTRPATGVVIPAPRGQAAPPAGATAQQAASAAALTRVTAAITRYQHRLTSDSAGGLRDTLAGIFASAGISVQRQARLSAVSTAGFLTSAGVAIEVAVSGAADEVARQLSRCAACPDVTGLVLVTPCARHRAVPGRIHGKPVHVAWVSGIS